MRALRYMISEIKPPTIIREHYDIRSIPPPTLISVGDYSIGALILGIGPSGRYILYGTGIWELPKTRGTLFWGPYL